MRAKSLLMLMGLLVLLVLPIQAQDTPTPTSETTFGEIIFALDVNLQSVEPLTPLNRFPAGIAVVVALVDITGLQTGATVTTQWLLNGTLETALSYTHESNQPDFRMWTPLINTNGIGAGNWTMRLLLNGNLVKSGDFEVTDAPFIYPLRFGTACGRFTNQLYGEVSEYEAGTQHLYAQIRFANFPQSTPIAGVWAHDGAIIEAENLPIETTLTGSGYRCFNIGDPRGLASGEYRLSIVNGNNTLTSASIIIGVPEPEFDTEEE